MTSMLLFLASSFLTAMAALLIWRDALAHRGTSRHVPTGQIVSLVGAAIVFNIWALHLIETVTDNGINFTLATGVALATLIIQIIYCFGVLRHGIQGLGLFLLPATAVPLLLLPFLPEAHAPNWIHTGSLLESGHLLISLVAYAILTLAAVHALMQIMLDRALKRKRLTSLVQVLPPLMDIDRHMIAQVKAATVLIALSIVSGLVWQWSVYQRFEIMNHKVLLALFAFGVLILLLIKRARAAWPTRIASKVVLSAYLLLMLAYFGVKLIESFLY